MMGRNYVEESPVTPRLEELCDAMPAVEFTGLVDEMTSYLIPYFPRPLKEVAREVGSIRAELAEIPKAERTEERMEVFRQKASQRYNAALTIYNEVMKNYSEIPLKGNPHSEFLAHLVRTRRNLEDLGAALDKFDPTIDLDSQEEIDGFIQFLCTDRIPADAKLYKPLVFELRLKSKYDEGKKQIAAAEQLHRVA